MTGLLALTLILLLATVVLLVIHLVQSAKLLGHIERLSTELSHGNRGPVSRPGREAGRGGETASGAPSETSPPPFTASSPSRTTPAGANPPRRSPSLPVPPPTRGPPRSLDLAAPHRGRPLRPHRPSRRKCESRVVRLEPRGPCPPIS